jgi:hypothetical protein
MRNKSGILGQINNNIVTDGLIYYLDPAYKISTIPSSTTTKAFNIIDTTISGSFINDTMYDSSTVTPSFAFDGAGDRIESNFFNTIASQTEGTFGMWLYHTNTSGNTYIFSAGDGSTNWNVKKSNFAILNSPRVLFIGSYGSSNVTLQSTHTISLNTWYYVTVTSEMKLYVNGVETDSGTSTWFSNIDTYNFFGFGQLKFNGSWYGAQEHYGYIGPVQFYNRALSAGEVLQNYQAQKERFGL